LKDLPLFTEDDYSVYVRSGVELRLELIALVGTEAEKRKAREELEELTPCRLTPQEIQEIEGLQNEVEQHAIIDRGRDRWRRGITV
jgi:hypothetical protein